MKRGFSTKFIAVVLSGLPKPFGTAIGLWSVDAGMVDIVGLSISDYALLDPYWQSFFFDDPTTPKTNITVADVVADPNINVPGGSVFYSATRNLIVIYGLSPNEAVERRLWKYLFSTQFEAMSDNGAAMFDNGQPMYEVANA